MYEGFLRLGQVEIANASRTEAYVANVLPGFPLKGCQGTADLPRALGESYNSPLQDGAPWIDPQNPATYRFLGLYPISIEGIDGSTVVSTVTESISDGGYVNSPRATSREIRVRGVLVAEDEVALAAGQTWLNEVLANTRCEGDSGCNGAVLDYFVAPPVFGEVCYDPSVAFGDSWPLSGLVPGSVHQIGYMTLTQDAYVRGTITPIEGWDGLTFNWGVSRWIGSIENVDADPLFAYGPVTPFRTNKVRNPQFSVNTGLWGTDATLAQIATGGPANGSFGRVTFFDGLRHLQTSVEGAIAGPNMLQFQSRTDLDSFVVNLRSAVDNSLIQTAEFSGSSTWAEYSLPVPNASQGILEFELEDDDPSLRVNNVLNPSPQVSGTGWLMNTSGASVGARTAGVGVAGDYGFSATYTARNTSASEGATAGRSNFNDILVTPGETIYPSMYVRSPNASHFGAQMRVFFFDAANAVVGSSPLSTAFDLVAGGAYQRIQMGATVVPATATHAIYRIVNANAATTTGTVRMNMAPKPYPTSLGSGWLSNNGTLWVPAHDTTFVRRAGTASSRQTRTATSPSQTAGSWYSVGSTADTVAGRPAVVAGTQYTFSCYFAASFANATVQGRIEWFDAAGVIIGAAVVQPVQATTTPANTWARGSYTPAAAPAGAVSVRYSFNVLLPSGLTVGGEQVWIQDALVEAGASLGTYFDGDLPQVGRSAIWTGTRLASESQLNTQDPWEGTRTNLILNPGAEANPLVSANATGVGTVVTRDTAEKYSGTASFKVVTGGNINDGIFILADNTINYTIGQVYSGSIRVKAPAGASLYAALRSAGGVGDVTVAFTGTGNWQYVPLPTHTSSVAPTGRSIFIRAAAAVPSFTFYVDEVLMEFNSLLGSYFSGASTVTGRTAAWTGTADNSPSTLSGDVVLIDRASTADGTYFDGATADTPTEEFVWSGTAYNSVSRAEGEHQFDVTNVLLEAATQLFPYFDGDSIPAMIPSGYPDAPDPEYAVEWLGVPNQSESRMTWLGAPIHWEYCGLGYYPWLQVVSGYGSVALSFGATLPKPDSEIILDYARYMRDVSRIAGPTVSQNLKTNIGVGRVVEFLMVAATPYSYAPGINTYDWNLDFEDPMVFTDTTPPVDPPVVVVDPDCPVVPAPPRPPVIDNACVVTPGTWDRYFIPIYQNYVSRWSAVLPRFTFKGQDEYRQLRVRTYRNPLGVHYLRTNLALRPYPNVAGGWETQDAGRFPVTTESVDVRRVGSVASRIDRTGTGLDDRIAAWQYVGGTSNTYSTQALLTGSALYYVGISLYFKASNSPNARYAFTLRWYSAAGVLLDTLVQAPQGTISDSNSWTRASITAPPSPPTTARLRVDITFYTASGSAATGDESVIIQDFQIESSELTEYFDGAGFKPLTSGVHSDDGNLTYAWTGTAFASTSTANLDPFGFEQEFIVSYMPAGSLLVVDSTVRRSEIYLANTGTSLSPYSDTPISAANLLYGQDGGPMSWPEFTCGDSYYVTVDVPPGTGTDMAVGIGLTRRE